MSDPEYITPRRSGILDVAQRAGVSRQTVTRAMNDMPGISEETRKRVLEAAREMHYRPSRFGRGLVTKGTPTLGLIVVDLRNSFWAELASAVLDAATRQGWTVLIAESSHGEAVVETLAAQVDAVIGHLQISDDRIDQIFGAMPLVLFLREPHQDSRALIWFDLNAAIDNAVEHLTARGRRRIVMLDWSEDYDASERGEAYTAALQARDLDPRLLVVRREAEPTVDSGKQAASRANIEWPDADAFLCFNDVVAIGTIKHLTASGLSIPRDVSVIGIDGLTLGQIVTPELTTLEFNFPSIADQAVAMLRQIQTGSMPIRGPRVHQSVSPRLTIRESS